CTGSSVHRCRGTRSPPTPRPWSWWAEEGEDGPMSMPSRTADFDFGDSTGDQDADRILEALRGAPEGMARHESRRGLFGDHMPAAIVASKLELLLRLGLVRSQAEPETGGRPAERWFASSPCVKSGIGVESRPDTSPYHLDAPATEAAAESSPTTPPAK